MRPADLPLRDLRTALDSMQRRALDLAIERSAGCPMAAAELRGLAPRREACHPA
jgi:hypothetical protein